MGFIARVALAIAVSFVVTVVVSKLMIPQLKKKKAQQHVRDDGPQSHLVKEGTPTMGGIMIVIGVVAATLLFSSYADSASWTVMAFMVATLLLFALIGFLDDAIKLFKRRSLGLRAWQKVVLQLAVAAAVACFAYFVMGRRYETVPFAGGVWDLGSGYIPFTMFVFLAMVNSVNLTDGLDGLATSLTLTNGAAFLAVIVLLFPGLLLLGGGAFSGADGYVANIAVFACALIGACIGFLCFNKHPAKVFMGDTGSFALGAAITVIAASLGMQLLLPIMGFLFVLSAVSVIIQVGSFKIRHKRVFKMAPLHHHFELCGIPETRVVAGYVAATVVLSVLAVLSVAFAA